MAYNPDADKNNAAWRDAYFIAWIGASNPIAVERSITDWSALVGADHHAVVAMQGQLDFLQLKSLGPHGDILGEVLDNARRLGLETS